MLKFCWLVALLLSFLSTAHAWDLSPELIGLVADHLKAPAAQLTSSSTLPQGFSIRTNLHGIGFHRTLEINISHEADAHSLRECQLAVLQPLPSSMYADPYQLEELTRSYSSSNSDSRSEDEAAQSSTGSFDGGSAPTCAYNFTLLGPLDLELPAPACKANVLLLEFHFDQHTHQQQPQQHQQQEQQIGASLAVPLHAKYPEPRAYGYIGWQALSSGHVHLSVPQPWLLVDCRATGGMLHVMQPRDAPQHLENMVEGENNDKQQQQQQNVLIWSIPAGNLDHLQLVSWGTLVVSAVCSGVLSMRALQLLVSDNK